MMQKFMINFIGNISVNSNGTFLELKPKYLPAIQGLDGFSHLNVLWWLSDFDQDEYRNILDTPKPYTKAPNILGIFATRSPIRPNPIALTAVQVLNIDHHKGVIKIAYIDANDGTPILDIKPYTPSSDRVESPKVPGWCRHWPMSLEESESFPWEDEFTF